MQRDSKLLFEYVKTDNLASFCALIKTDADLQISFGRFPLLTVCYLYNSKKIIKKFFKKLAKIQNFETMPEPFEIYLKFKSVAKKSLRLYAGQQNLVMPIEMLAMQNNDALVKKYYKIMQKTPKTNGFLRKIYEFNEQNIKIENDKIKISHKKISKKTKIWLVASHSALFTLGAIIACVLILISNAYGLGTYHSPKKIADVQSFANLAGRNCYATLLDDIEIDDDCLLKNFNGTIWGNNKTITINSYNDFLIDTLNGKIQDVNIVFNCEIDKTATSDLGLFVKTNNGEISNVNIIVNSDIKITLTGISSGFSGLAINNNKYIHDCSIKFVAELNSESTNDNFASLIAINNNGIISACEISEGSSIKATNIDAAGVACQNYASAEISTCKNNANILQDTSFDTWSPNVAGIAMTNMGTITNCINNGNLTVNSSSTTKSNNGIFVGGICSQNFSLVNHCKNTGNIISESEMTAIYAGGITAYTYQKSNSNPEISNCASTGNFNLTKNNNDTFIYCGGISGYMIGTISNCYSTATFEQGYDEETNKMIALMIGASSGQAFYGIQIYLDISNIHCLSVAQTSKTLAIAYVNMGYTYIENLTADITLHLTTQEIEGLDIYW